MNSIIKIMSIEKYKTKYPKSTIKDYIDYLEELENEVGTDICYKLSFQSAYIDLRDYLYQDSLMESACSNPRIMFDSFYYDFENSNLIDRRYIELFEDNPSKDFKTKHQDETEAFKDEKKTYCIDMQLVDLVLTKKDKYNFLDKVKEFRSNYEQNKNEIDSLKENNNIGYYIRMVSREFQKSKPNKTKFDIVVPAKSKPTKESKSCIIIFSPRIKTDILRELDIYQEYTESRKIIERLFPKLFNPKYDEKGILFFSITDDEIKQLQEANNKIKELSKKLFDKYSSYFEGIEAEITVYKELQEKPIQNLIGDTLPTLRDIDKKIEELKPRTSRK